MINIGFFLNNLYSMQKQKLRFQVEHRASMHNTQTHTVKKSFPNENCMRIHISLEREKTHATIHFHVVVDT